MLKTLSVESQPYQRVFNFSAGPAGIPVPVLEEARDQLLNYQNHGCSVMEMSHRSKEFLAIIENTEKDLREYLKVPNNYSILFLQGGASLQFCMIPLNLSDQSKTVDIIQTGSWTKKATEEIKKISKINIVASSEKNNFLCLPKKEEFKFSDNPAYIHMASNNTIFGTQVRDFPKIQGIPLVADMSSDILSRPIDVSQFGLIFAGAQKNMGLSGVTLVIIRNDLLERTPNEIPLFLRYGTHVEAKSLYNTPPTFGIYILGLVLKWLKEQGGIEKIKIKNKEKAAFLYKAIDESSSYECPIPNEDRSDMNVVFHIKASDKNLEVKELEDSFVREAKENRIINIKGHRSIGGLRASLYNAMPLEGVHSLIQFMQDFSKKYL